MKPICLSLLILFSMKGWSQGNTERDYEILKVINLAGQTGNDIDDNAVKISFPGRVNLSKIVYSYSYDKYPDDPQVDTILFDDFTSANQVKRRKLKFRRDKMTTTELKVVSAESTIEFSVKELDKRKVRARFHWGAVGQPKIYGPGKQKRKKLRKRKYNKWLLKEVKIYVKESPVWFEEKEIEATYPRISIENMLLGFAEKGLGNDRTAANDGITPRLVLSNLANASTINISQPSLADRENCGTIGYRYDNIEYKSFEPLKLHPSMSSVDIEFFNDDGYYEEDHLTCKPKIELMFQVPNRIERLPLEVTEYGLSVRDTIINTIAAPPTKEEVKCECGTIACGRVTINFTPEQRTTKIYRNKQYRVIKNGLNKETVLVVEREPVYEEILVDTAFIYNVEIKSEEDFSYRKAQYNKGGNQISITNLNSGNYFLKVSWKLRGVSIDTTIFNDSRPLQIEKHIDVMTRVDTIFFTIDQGADCSPEFELSMATPIEEKCITRAVQDTDCDYDKTAIPIRRDSDIRFLIVGLDRDGLANFDPSEHIPFSRNGELLPFTTRGGSIKNVNCPDCENYEDNEIYWNSTNRLGGIIIFDLAKTSASSVSFTAKQLVNDGPVNIYYQFISLTSR